MCLVASHLVDLEQGAWACKLYNCDVGVFCHATVGVAH